MANIIVKGNREDAIHALINTWLKDERRWCLSCNKDFDILDWQYSGPCCVDAYLTTNSLVMKHFIKEVDITKSQNLDEYGSTKDKSMRHLLKFPPGLLQFLEISMQILYNEKLFTEEYDQVWFAKHFGKYFCVAEKI